MPAGIDPGMKPLLAALTATALLGAFLSLGACATSGQKQAQEGELQLPGERPAPTALNVPPDEWAGPPRTTQTATAR